MSLPNYSIAYTEGRSRVTTLFRGLLALPHLVVMQAWQYLVQVLTVLQWFIILFTGRRNQGIWNMQNAWLGYAARVWSYYSLMYDTWPNIGPEKGAEPTDYSFEYSAPANRLTNFFRFIWLIPTVIVALFVIIGATIVTLLTWITIVFTGKHPRGWFDFVARTHTFMVRVEACALLMSDTRPRFGASA